MPLSSMHIIIIIIIIIITIRLFRYSIIYYILCLYKHKCSIYINFIRYVHFSSKVRYIHVFLNFKAQLLKIKIDLYIGNIRTQ